jgi:hypothetical protein
MWRCCRKRAFCKWHMTSLICMLSSPTRMIWFIDLYWSLKLGWFWGVRWECFDTFGCGETREAFLASLYQRRLVLPAEWELFRLTHFSEEKLARPPKQNTKHVPVLWFLCGQGQARLACGTKHSLYWLVIGDEYNVLFGFGVSTHMPMFWSSKSNNRSVKSHFTCPLFAPETGAVHAKRSM